MTEIWALVPQSFNPTHAADFSAYLVGRSPPVTDIITLPPE